MPRIGAVGIVVVAFFVGALGQGCPNMWTHMGQSCYLLGGIEATFITASEYCESFGNAFLAEVESEDENINLKAFLMQQNTENVVGVWLGGNDMQAEGYWQWDKSMLPFAYEDWDAGQPDDDHIRDQDCLAMFKNRQFKWVDHWCTSKLDFVCEQPVD